MTLSENLLKAKRAKNDEFYTQETDIENELVHYKQHFKDKIVYCNCDDPWISNFFRYFAKSFKLLGLKKLITTCYKNQQRDFFSKYNSEQAIMLEYDGFREGEREPKVEDIGITHLKEDGDFRSEESIELLKQTDVVVTNPPFSLFREYFAQLVEYNKKFLIIGPWNAVSYKDIFPLIKGNSVWLGYGFKGGGSFAVPNVEQYVNKPQFNPKTGLVKFGNVTWFTNLDHNKRHEELVLYRKYQAEDYPHYDNYDAIEVGRVRDIPKNWGGGNGSSDYLSG